MQASTRLVVMAEMVLLSALGFFAPGHGEGPLVPRPMDAATTPLLSPTPVVATALTRRVETMPLRASAITSPVAAAGDLGHRYATATDKRALFEELRDSGNSESLYFAAEILADCLDVAEHGFETAVNDFTDHLSGESPTMAKQVEAFRRLIEPCAGFDGRHSSQGEIRLLHSAGAQRGDPRAVAHLLGSADTDSPANAVGAAADLLALDDPQVIREVSSYLAGLFAGGMMIDGATLDASENGPVTMAWALVACDYGATCDAAHPEVLQACARGGLCGLESLDELFRLTYVPLDTYQRGQVYRARILAALQRRDYASLGLDAARF